MAISSPKLCNRCNKVHQGECKTHNWGDDKERGNRHQRGYGNRWDRLRKAVMSRDNFMCQPCKQRGRVTAAREVDHIVPKAKGGTDDIDNLQAICIPCHKDKTARENGKCKTEYGADGLPLDIGHHWNTGESK